jgi:hypothetical protein
MMRRQSPAGLAEWYTQMAQTHLPARACGFDSRTPHGDDRSQPFTNSGEWLRAFLPGDIAFRHAQHMTTTGHPSHIRTSAVSLLRDGRSNREVAAELAVSAGTVGYWKHLDRKRHPDAYPPLPWESCPACYAHEIAEKPYSYLLGLYLGDGHITHKYRQHTLSIACTNTWPGLIDAAQEAMQRVMPGAKTGRRQCIGCVEVKSYSAHWVCLFPQHGPGKKHLRPIVLEEWQRFVVDDHPKEFIRGLIHSDGCRVINWTTRVIGGEKKRYEYPRYHFTNESTDIRDLFTDRLDELGIEWRMNNRNTVSIARRESVAYLDEFVGPKY